MKTEVYVRKAAQFDMGGKFLGYPLKAVEESITEGLARRLVVYASRRLLDSGFIVEGWEVTVEAVGDPQDGPSDRVYAVSWENAKGGTLAVQGIYTRSGWPFLDHGLAVAG